MYQAGKIMSKLVVKAIEYDENGIEIQFLNNTRKETVKVCPGD